jgi:hypothetical protein
MLALLEDNPDRVVQPIHNTLSCSPPLPNRNACLWPLLLCLRVSQPNQTLLISVILSLLPPAEEEVLKIVHLLTALAAYSEIDLGYSLLRLCFVRSGTISIRFFHHLLWLLFFHRRSTTGHSRALLR